MAETAPSWLVVAEQGAELQSLRTEVAELRKMVVRYQVRDAEAAKAEPVEHLGVSALAARYGIERATVTNWVRRSGGSKHPFPTPAITVRAPKLWVPGWHPRQLPVIDAWRLARRALDRRR